MLNDQPYSHISVVVVVFLLFLSQLKVSNEGDKRLLMSVISSFYNRDFIIKLTHRMRREMLVITERSPLCTFNTIMCVTKCPCV